MRAWIPLWLAASLLVATGAAPAAAAPARRIAYGLVVDASARAVVLELADGAWLAVNAGPQTNVFASPGRLPQRTFASVAPGDWALAYYTVQTRSSGGRAFSTFVAQLVRFAPSPFALGGPVRLSGRVRSMFNLGFVAVTARGRPWLVYVTPETRVLLGGVASAFTFLQVGDAVRVEGVRAGDTIGARTVRYSVRAGAP